MQNKLQQFWTTLEKDITHNGIMPEQTALLIPEIQKKLSSRLNMRKWIPFGSVHCGLGIKGQSDWDFLVIIPVKELIFSREPKWAVRRLEAILSDICQGDIQGHLDPPAFTLWHKDSPENHIDIVYGISRMDIGDENEEEQWDSETKAEMIAELDSEPYFFPGTPTVWSPTNPQALNTILNKLDILTNGLARSLIKFLKIWKHNKKIPITTFFIETFIFRWFYNTHNMQGNLGDIDKQIDILGDKYQVNRIESISEGIERITKDLYDFLLKHIEKDALPTLSDPCVYAWSSDTYACSWIYELGLSMPIFLEDLKTIKEARRFEKNNEDDNAIAKWEDFLGIKASTIDEQEKNYMNNNYVDCSENFTPELYSKLKHDLSVSTDLCNSGYYEEAIVIFDKIIQTWATCEHALNNKAGALAELERHNEAIEWFDKLLEVNPKYSDGWYGKGNSLLALERYEEAIKCYDRAIDVCQKEDEYKSIDYWHNKGVAFNKLGFIRDAKECFKAEMQIKSPPNQISGSLPLKLGIVPD